MPIEDHFEDTNMVPAWPFKLQSLEFSPATSNLPASCNPVISGIGQGSGLRKVIAALGIEYHLNGH